MHMENNEGHNLFRSPLSFIKFIYIGSPQNGTDRVEASPLPESLAASGVGTAKAGTKKKARKYVVKCMIICDLRDSCKDYFW